MQSTAKIPLKSGPFPLFLGRWGQTRRRSGGKYRQTLQRCGIGEEWKRESPEGCKNCFCRADISEEGWDDRQKHLSDVTEKAHSRSLDQVICGKVYSASRL